MKGKPNYKADEAAVELRVQEIVQIILDGAESWDIFQYCAEKQVENKPPWNRPKSAEPLTERQIRNYIARAKEKIVAAGMEQDADAVRHHLAKLRSLYARAVNSGDLSNARAVLNDIASMLDLYPPKKIKSEQSGVLSIQIQADDEFYAKHRLEGPEADGTPTPGTE